MWYQPFSIEDQDAGEMLGRELDDPDKDLRLMDVEGCWGLTAMNQGRRRHT